MRRTLFPVLLALSASCGGSDDSPVQPTLSDIQARIFNGSCTFSSCHTAFARRGNLVLQSGQSFNNLVNVPADHAKAKERNKIRVVPGNPLSSFLYQKLDQSPALLAPDEGDPMPQVGQRLPQQRIDAVRMWIERGAPND
jgi:hypothetical protein